MGVVQDTRVADLGTAPDLYGYMPFPQYYTPILTFVVHGNVGAGPLREVLLALDPALAIPAFRPCVTWWARK